ncbi:MAG: hypothetical protein ACUZ8O_09680 [Candidatus Anammoxibacter sp.]
MAKSITILLEIFMYIYQAEELLKTAKKFGLIAGIDKATEVDADDSCCVAIGNKKYLNYSEALAQIIYLEQMKRQMITYIKRRESRMNAIKAN